MRLHTDFHDYYDNAVGYGIDENVHFNRFTKKIGIQIKSKLDLPHDDNAGLLGFCGKIRPFIEFRKYNRKYYEEGASDSLKIVERYYAFSLEEYKSQEFKWKDYASPHVYHDYSRETKLKQFFVDWNYRSDDIFLEYKVPIWAVKLDRNLNEGVINPKLKDYGFDRITDSLTAFQEISMYLSNILVEQKEGVLVEDKIRIEKHGFDLKTSFRKEKQ